jgi:hypothetical protein
MRRKGELIRWGRFDLFDRILKIYHMRKGGKRDFAPPYPHHSQNFFAARRNRTVSCGSDILAPTSTRNRTIACLVRTSDKCVRSPHRRTYPESREITCFEFLRAKAPAPVGFGTHEKKRPSRVVGALDLSSGDYSFSSTSSSSSTSVVSVTSSSMTASSSSTSSSCFERFASIQASNRFCRDLT